LQGIVASRQRQEKLLGVLHGEEEAHVEVEAHMVQAAHAEREAQVEVAAHMEQEAPEEEGAGQGEASRRSTTG
jgi:hypothetical protein